VCDILKRLIVVDGLDGCGKDTHTERIRRAIEAKGGKVAIMKHPSQGLFGRMSKKALLKSGPLAVAAATTFYTLDVLISVRTYRRRRSGTFIFIRYLLGTAYLPKTLATPAYSFFSRLLPSPDLAIFIDIDPVVALRRIEQRDHRREMFETREKLVRARDVARSLVGDDWVTLDNSKDGEEPFEEAQRVLLERGFL
jgi:dTMP kinase